jgi:(p)ppGpp synthase/HD superfamily hydrolase
MKPTLEDAIQIAVQAHRGQRDKTGQPYILHPLRVALRMKTNVERIVAVLHDVVEDTPITLTELARWGFPQEVLDAVDCLTKREGESYAQFILRAKSNPIARRVKIADLEDNMDLRRLVCVSEADRTRLKKYTRARAQLTCGL